MTNDPLVKDPPGEVFPVTPTERVTVVVLALVEGAVLTSGDVAEMTGLTTGAARRLLENISRVAGVYEENGLWWMPLKCAGRTGGGV